MRAVHSAPGKLVLLGEYAVLFGAPAAVMAVDRRARVEIRPADGDVWTVDAPGLLPGPVPFLLEADGSVAWRASPNDPPPRLPLLEGLLRGGVASGLLDARDLRPADLRLDTRAFFAAGPGRGPTKLGLGSSSALTVALASGLASWSGRADLVADRPGWLAALLDLHRAVQGGRGSGIDLAAALHGGVLEYRLQGRGAPPSSRPLSLPGDLRLVFVWTGSSADTGSFLRRLEERMEHDGGSILTALERLGDASAAGIAALDRGDVGSTLTAVEQSAEALDALGRAAGLPILSPAHAALRELLGRQGASYKPSGAGGGDLGVAFAPNPDVAKAAAAAAETAGFSVLDLELDRTGLTSDRL